MPIPTASQHLSSERPSLSQIAIDQIRGAIMDGTLVPGEDLHDDDLQAWLGMSRTPVREAISELTRLGLVETAAQRYTRVARIDPATVRWDLQTIGALLGGVARVTIPTLSDEGVAQLVATADEALAALDGGDSHAFMASAIAVGAILREHCTNGILLHATTEVVDAKIYRISQSHILLDADVETLKGNYRRLREAIAERDGVAAELAAAEIFQLDVPVRRP